MKKKSFNLIILILCCLLLVSCSKGNADEKVETDTESQEASKKKERNKKDKEDSGKKDTDEAEEPDESPYAGIYKEFFDYISDADPSEWDGFKLIDLDGDGIYELFATNSNGKSEDPAMQPYLVLGHNDDGIVINDFLQDGVAGVGGYRGSLYCLEGHGKIYESAIYAPFGEPSDTVYVLDNGELILSDQGYFEFDRSVEMSEDLDIFENGEWYWNDKIVSEEEYARNLEKATDNARGYALYDLNWSDKASIKKELKKAAGRDTGSADDSKDIDLKELLLKKAGASEDELCNYIEDDFDGDGKKEAFALIGTEFDEFDQMIVEGAVWFVSANECKNLRQSTGMGISESPRHMTVGGTDYLLFDDLYVTESVTYVWSVSDGTVIEAPFSGVGNVYTDPSDEKDCFRILKSAYDGEYDHTIDAPIGHTWKNYYFFYNDETGRVEEFAGTAISQDNVPFLCDIDIVEEKLPKGDKVDSLFCRGNGLIVLNYEHEEDDTTYYYHYIYDFTKGYYIDDYGDEVTGDEPLMGTCAVTICPDIANYPEVPGPGM